MCARARPLTSSSYQCFLGGVSVSDFHVVVIINTNTWKVSECLMSLYPGSSCYGLCLNSGSLPVNTAVWVIFTEQLCGEWPTARSEQGSTWGKEQQETTITMGGRSSFIPQLNTLMLMFWATCNDAKGCSSVRTVSPAAFVVMFSFKQAKLDYHVARWGWREFCLYWSSY